MVQMRLRVILQPKLLARRVAKQSSDAVSGSAVTDSTPASGSTPSGGEQKTAPETVLTKPKPKPNNPPVAKAGLDQVVKEGDKVTLDSSAIRILIKTLFHIHGNRLIPEGQALNFILRLIPKARSIHSPRCRQRYNLQV